MMTQQIGFSVLTAPLAAIDRRALSQAWYSALHLAKDHAPKSEGAKHLSFSNAAHGRQAAQPARHERQEIAAPPAHAIVGKRKSVHQPPLERRAMRSALARKIEGSFLHPGRSVQRATFTIDGTQSRVHIALQTSGTNMRLIAICPPNLRVVVARALEEARYALAERGIVLSAETEER